MPRDSWAAATIRAKYGPVRYDERRSTPEDVELPSWSADIGMIVLTDELIEAGRTPRGGFNLRQLAALGITGFETAWKRRLIGRRVLKSDYALFLSLAGAPPAKRKRPRQPWIESERPAPRFATSEPDLSTSPPWDESLCPAATCG